jgi:hypothetical protein
MDTDEGKRPGSLNNRVPYQDFTFPVTAFTRWDEKAGLPRDAIRSQ